MVLQTSGAITLSDIRGEFGGTAPDLLSEYYRGGGLVPDTPANSGIPTSGAIKLSDFYSGDATTDSVILTNQSSNHFSPSATVYAGFIFATDGSLYGIGPGAFDSTLLDTDQWWSARPDTGIGSSYDVRCASVGLVGQTWSTQAAAIGTWVNISSGLIWRVKVLGFQSPDMKLCVGSFEIRPAGGGSTLATAQLSASAEN